MGLFDFLRNKKSSKRKESLPKEEPSEEQLAFAEVVLEIVGQTVESFEFSFHNKEIGPHSTTITWRKDKRYVKVNSTTYPTDYPYHYSVVLGEGDSGDFFEYDWNSVAIWALAQVSNSNKDSVSYDFPTGKAIRPSIEKANSQLIDLGTNFLTGNLETFYAARKLVNEGREPYKIHSPDADGNYQTTNEPESEKQKKKYS